MERCNDGLPSSRWFHPKKAPFWACFLGQISGDYGGVLPVQGHGAVPIILFTTRSACLPKLICRASLNALKRQLRSIKRHFILRHQILWAYSEKIHEDCCAFSADKEVEDAVEIP